MLYIFILFNRSIMIQIYDIQPPWCGTPQYLYIIPICIPGVTMVHDIIVQELL